ncbi:DUF4376 domain-containing protein [Bradyrhizobium tropiciagri]|uniref:DUF4376 domain-containing protein n=1 Tax=Bradyrhizobium tropiciagri TaxID=312253 RepID=UPI001BAB56B0|nr:DUF4376 domain-containing protein [Bradyrhizobium tropiciagri]MBR0871211.1 DUF4376 domain-containing protein [Bradyrhizobium tropiciagri]
MYDPFNWYWLADDGRLFSSAVQAVVPADDAAYQAWRAGGRAATRWPADAAGLQTTMSLQDVLTPYGLYVDLKVYAAAVRYAKETGGVTVGEVRYPTDRETQSKLTAAAVFAQVDGSQTFRWKLADGTFAPVLTASEMIAVAAAIGGFVNACFATEQDVVTRIDSGAIVNRSQVDAAFG